MKARHVLRHFNPRTPCGVRLNLMLNLLWGGTFQSTHPLRGATSGTPRDTGVEWHFNPRTPCGVRPFFGLRKKASNHFNPRTPCGVRQVITFSQRSPEAFQSTHPLRGATTPRCRRCPCSIQNFNPRTPCGVRPQSWSWSRRATSFQSTHPLRGATRSTRTAARPTTNFNPRTPCGVRQQKRTKKCGTFAQKV